MTPLPSSPALTATASLAPDVPSQRPAPTACGTCGTEAPPGTVRTSGSWSATPAGGVWDCLPCTRSHLPSIESGFDLRR